MDGEVTELGEELDAEGPATALPLLEGVSSAIVESFVQDDCESDG